MAWVEDRWMVRVRDDDGRARQVRSSRHGTGKRYRVRYETADGREVAESFDRKADADARRDEVAADLRKGTFLDRDAGKISLREYAEEWLAIRTIDDASMVNIRFRVRHILAGKLGDKRLDQLAASPSSVQAWVSGLKLAPYSARQCFTALSSICKAAVDDGRMGRNPCNASSITLPALDDQKVVPLEQQHVSALRAALPPKYRALVDAGVWCGGRQGELLGLSPDDVDRGRGTLAICRQVKIVRGALCFALPKGKKTRVVPLSNGLAESFDAHVEEFGACEVTLPWHQPGHRRHGKPVTVRLIFTGSRNQAIRRNSFNAHVWKPALRRAGLPDTAENGIHVLRHTYASVLLANGADIKRVAACLGHADAGFTLRVYGHLMEGGEEMVRNILDSVRTVPSPDSGKIV